MKFSSLDNTQFDMFISIHLTSMNHIIKQLLLFFPSIWWFRYPWSTIFTKPKARWILYFSGCLINVLTLKQQQLYNINLLAIGYKILFFVEAYFVFFIQDIFWYLFLDKFQSSKNSQVKLFNRAAFNYVKLMLYVRNPQYRDVFFKVSTYKGIHLLCTLSLVFYLKRNLLLFVWMCKKHIRCQINNLFFLYLCTVFVIDLMLLKGD